MRPQLIVVVGPTASGKTALAIRLAQEMGAGIVSADSRQVYRGMDIGTAKDLTHKHYLVDMKEPNQPLTLAEWQQEAFRMIDRLIADSIVPLLVGGTMLYVDSVVDNYEIPAVSPDMRLRERWERESTEALYERLLQLDPAAGAFIAPENKRRIIRALEVVEVTGKLFSAQRRVRESRYDVTMIGIHPGWDELREHIAARARQMFRDGLLDETRRLQEHYGADLPLLQTLNYREAAKALADKLSEEEAVSEMIHSNMRYARRQMSWWRRRSDIRWITNPESFSLSDLSQLRD